MASSMQAGKQASENLTLKTYEKKVKEDIRLINDNLHEMLKLFRIEDDRTMRVCSSSFLFFKNSIFL
jgi:hypothetical protein